MLKKFSKFIFLIISGILIFPSLWFSFLDDDLWLNLYKNLDEWLEDLKIKQYEFEINWWEENNLAGNINKILDENLSIWECIKDNITTEAIEIIAYWDISKLSEYLNETCTKDDKLATEFLIDLLNEIKSIYNNSKQTADEKSKKIYEVSRIWLYSDWTTSNSPFDLIIDLQEIDKIIFTQDIEYEWEDMNFLSDFKNSPFIPRLNPEEDGNYIPSYPITENEENNTNEIENENTWNIPTNQNTWETTSIPQDPNSIVCATSNSISSSWLKPSEILNIQNNINQNNQTNNNTRKAENTWYQSDYIWYTAMQNPDFNSSSYAGVNDNTQWPCSDFFCINIDFSTYEQKALWYWQSISIENLLTRSNEHLKKAVNTSLQQWKMTTNNFEVWLRDIDLVGMFHMWFVIQKKAPPILNLENIVADKNAHPSSSKVKKMLEEYYKNMWFDYSRANDLSIFTWEDFEQKNVISWAELSPTTVSQRQKEIADIQNKLKEKNDYINNQTDKQINSVILDEFYQELIELDTFIAWIETYSFSLSWLIKKLREIPVNKW